MTIAGMGMTAALGAMVLLAAGCATGTRVPTEYYALTPTPAIARSAQADGTLAVRRLDTSAAYREPIAYREGAHRIGYYPAAHWAEHPRDMVTRALVDGLLASGRFKDVGNAFDMPRPDFLLLGELRRFEEEHVPEGRFAVCEVHIELRDAQTRQAIWTETLRMREPVEGPELSALAAAMSHAVARVVEEAVGGIQRLD